MRVRLGGKYWTLRFSPNLHDFGDMVDPGRAAGRVLRVATWQSEEERLDTTLHEAIHACRQELDEKAVTDLANDLSRLLWRLGYRRQSSQ
jgi:hypothetical protein